jgi:hypothetical protein
MIDRISHEERLVGQGVFRRGTRCTIGPDVSGAPIAVQSVSCTLSLVALARSYLKRLTRVLGLFRHESQVQPFIVELGDYTSLEDQVFFRKAQPGQIQPVALWTAEKPQNWNSTDDMSWHTGFRVLVV